MRLPTEEEYDAFEAEEAKRHESCGKVCCDLANMVKLFKLLHGSSIMESVLAQSVDKLTITSGLEYAFVRGVFVGMQLQSKLIEQGALDKLCSGSH